MLLPKFLSADTMIISCDFYITKMVHCKAFVLEMYKLNMLFECLRKHCWSIADFACEILLYAQGKKVQLYRQIWIRNYKNN